MRRGGDYGYDAPYALVILALLAIGSGIGMMSAKTFDDRSFAIGIGCCVLRGLRPRDRRSHPDREMPSCRRCRSVQEARRQCEGS